MTDPDSLPTSSDPNGPCPRCGRVSNFSVQAVQVLDQPARRAYDSVGATSAAVLLCQGCGDATVTIQRAVPRVNVDPSQHPVEYAGVHWWPTPGATNLDPSVPAAVAAAFDEGMRCVGIQAPHAAVCMFRSTLAYVVKDKGSATAQAKPDLAKKLRQMATDGALHSNLADWADQIRQLGNIGAHPDELGEVSVEEGQELGRLCRELLSYLYDMPARIARSQAQRGTA